jgi:hypothetical protein
MSVNRCASFYQCIAAHALSALSQSPFKEVASIFQLSIATASPAKPIKVDGLIRLDRLSFKNSSFPSVIRASRECKAESITHLDGRGRQETARGFFSDNRCEVVLPRECHDHFRRTGSVPINEQNDSTVKGLRAEPPPSTIRWAF